MNGIRKVQWKQLVTVVLAWQVAAAVLAVYDHLMIHSVFVEIKEPLYSFWLHLLFNMSAALVGSLVAGPMIIFWVNERFINKPYGYSILLVVLLFVTMTTILILSLGIPYIYYTTGLAPGENGYWDHYHDYIFNLFQLKKLLSWSIIVAFTQFALQLDRKFGHGNLWKVIIGKYRLPREEYKVVMFADLTGSTAVAESIGDVKYHLLLTDFFSDVTNAIINNKGSIYNYVGDQVIVTWNIPGNHCIQCFFDMQQSIDDKKDTYLRKFGTVPSFKAGLHAGSVIAGEIGIIKRDITYSGDVLNTTSRIQDKCTELGVPFIVSSEVLEKTTLNIMYAAQPIGSMKLKGKQREIGLHSIRPM